MNDWINKVHCIDWIEGFKMLPNDSIDMLITSPPYWGLRDYGVEGQLGLEKTPEEYIEKLMQGFTEVKRVLKSTGTCWVNLGDTYGGSNSRGSQGHRAGFGNERDGVFKRGQEKCLTLIPERFALAMVESGWILRNRICWHKPNPMPSSVKDRFTNTWEYLFFFVKAQKYFFDLDAVREPHRESSFIRAKNKESMKATRLYKGHPGYHEDNHSGHTWLDPAGKNPGDTFKGSPPGQSADQFKRKGHSGYYDKEGNLLINPAGKNPGDFFEITTQPFPEAHFATFPEKLLEKPIKAGCPQWICKKCGKIRERVTDVERKTTRPDPKDSKYGNEKEDIRGGSINLRQRIMASYKTIGFTDCGCNAGWEGGIVLDPFMGSGTTAKVARKHSRNYIGFELNPEYIKIAEKRLAQGVLF